MPAGNPHQPPETLTFLLFRMPAAVGAKGLRLGYPLNEVWRSVVGELPRPTPTSCGPAPPSTAVLAYNDPP